MEWFGGAQEALGIFLNGPQVQVAHLRRSGGKMVLLGLERATLAHRLDARPEAVVAGGVDEVEDILGLEEVFEEEVWPAEEPDGEEEAGTNAEVFYRLLNRFPVRRCVLAVSVLETCVFYTNTPDTQGLKGRRLRRKLQEEALARPSSDMVLTEERFACFETGENRALSVVQEDPLEMLGILDELKPFIGNVQVGLIDPLEITLMNLARKTCPADSQVTAVVFVGEDFSRVVFLRDGHYLSFSQPINEGFRSPHILQTVASRILFEQDVAEVPEVGRMVLTGECRTIDAQPFFAGQFPEAEVAYLEPEELDAGELDEKDAELVSNFAVPIGMAWKALCPKEEAFYPSNFLPGERRRRQNPFEIAWHGLAVLILLAASGLLLGVQVRDGAREIDRLALSVDLMVEQLKEEQPYVRMVEELRGQVGDYERNFALIDTLSQRKLFWSDRLREIAGSTRTTGRVWLARVSTAEGGIDVQRQWNEPARPEAVAVSGTALRPDRVPALSRELGNGSVLLMNRSQIREATVYTFDMKLPALSVRE